MTINFKVRNMTIEAVPYFDSIRQGSEDFLRVAFEFDETWDEFKTKYIYFASEGYAEFFELNGNEHDVPKYYAAQEYFAIQLSGHNGTAKIPTNKIVVTLDPSGEIWTSEPPESMAEGIQQLIDTAEAAKSKADEASNQIKDIVDGKTCFKSICADVIKIGTEATINCEKREGNFATIRVADQSGDGGAIIRGIAAPIVSNDAATKNYVDKTVENAKVKTDATLSKEGIAADAKAVGEKLRELEDKSTKIPIITDTSGMKDGDMAVLVSEDGDNVPEPDYGNIPGGGVPDGDYVTDEEMQRYVANAIPKALPNPNALTFTGAVEGSYDGSKAVTVNIPQGGNTPMKLIYTNTVEQTSGIIDTVEGLKDYIHIYYEILVINTDAKSRQLFFWLGDVLCIQYQAMSFNNASYCAYSANGELIKLGENYDTIRGWVSNPSVNVQPTGNNNFVNNHIGISRQFSLTGVEMTNNIKLNITQNNINVDKITLRIWGC